MWLICFDGAVFADAVDVLIEMLLLKKNLTIMVTFLDCRKELHMQSTRPIYIPKFFVDRKFSKQFRFPSHGRQFSKHDRQLVFGGDHQCNGRCSLVALGLRLRVGS